MKKVTLTIDIKFRAGISEGEKEEVFDEIEKLLNIKINRNTINDTLRIQKTNYINEDNFQYLLLHLTPFCLYIEQIYKNHKNKFESFESQIYEITKPLYKIFEYKE